MESRTERRQALRTLGLGLAAGAAGMVAARGAEAAATAMAPSLEPAGARTLAALTHKLARAPRRRDFKQVPMILTEPGQWDHEALNEILAYRGRPKQVWDNQVLGGAWLNLMRNAMNAQIWSFRHADFLCVSGTHGSAHLALYDDVIWEKYDFAMLTGGQFKSNRFAQGPDGGKPSDYETADGLFSAKGDSIAVLQRRGAVFLACHNAIWELSGRLMARGNNPDHLSQEAMAAELTNHLIAGIVLTPGVVGTLVELQTAGFVYGT